MLETNQFCDEMSLWRNEVWRNGNCRLINIQLKANHNVEKGVFVHQCWINKIRLQVGTLIWNTGCFENNLIQRTNFNTAIIVTYHSIEDKKIYRMVCKNAWKAVTAQLLFFLCAVMEPFGLRSWCACVLRACYVRCWLVSTFLFFPPSSVMRESAPCTPFKIIFDALSYEL